MFDLLNNVLENVGNKIGTNNEAALNAKKE